MYVFDDPDGNRLGIVDVVPMTTEVDLRRMIDKNEGDTVTIRLTERLAG